MAFRFFINVDECLNMRNFDIFFYRDISRGRLQQPLNVSVKDGSGVSICKAMSDVRSCLDRFSYQIDGYQIIIAMRTSFNADGKVWGDTLLSRLLDIDFALKKANILINSGLEVQGAVNLVMLYESNEFKNIHAIDDTYLESSRFTDDCQFLLKEIGVPEGKENDFEVVRNAWKEYAGSKTAANGRTKDGDRPLFALFDRLIKKYEKDSSNASGAAGGISVQQALKKDLKNYQVFEMLVDNQNRNKDINSLLRLVEFATADEVSLPGTDNEDSVAAKCELQWKRVSTLKEQDLQKKYAEMLAKYKERLSRYVESTESGVYPGGISGEIRSTDGTLNTDLATLLGDDAGNRRKDGSEDSVTNIINRFKENLSPVATMLKRWEETYKTVCHFFEELEESLETETEQAGKLYAEKLRIRKDDEKTRFDKSLTQSGDTKILIAELKKERIKVLTDLGGLDIMPKLKFQERLNVLGKLETENQTVTHYIKCIQGVGARGFLLTVVLLTGLIALIYGVFQSYVFGTLFSLLCYSCYIGVSFIAMLFAWRRPLKYYGKQIKKSLDKFENETIKNYMTSYRDARDKIRNYIVLTDRLDSIERRIRRCEQAAESSATFAAATKWHTDQVKDHLKKLEFFEGLIKTYYSARPDITAQTGLADYRPEISFEQIDGIIESKLYWPQLS